jgi:hypothetical protein
LIGEALEELGLEKFILNSYQLSSDFEDKLFCHWIANLLSKFPSNNNMTVIVGFIREVIVLKSINPEVSTNADITSNFGMTPSPSCLTTVATANLLLLLNIRSSKLNLASFEYFFAYRCYSCQQWLSTAFLNGITKSLQTINNSQSQYY